MAVEIPITERVLTDRTLVKGVIYCIKHTESGKQYVGQTVTHRLNKGKYRPYGIRRRFAEHCSNAICNTKPSQSSCLYNAIRQYGTEAFTYHELEVCDIGVMDDRERYWIDQQGCTYPTGLNLTTGGAKDFHTIATVEVPPRGQPRPRGGCDFRSADTRARMSASMKVASASDDVKAKRSSNAQSQHNALKAARFAGVSIDTSNLDQYITIRKNLVLVKAGNQAARFAGKTESTDELVARAKEFLMSLCSTPSSDTISHIQATATLPNCSGNP